VTERARKKKQTLQSFACYCKGDNFYSTTSVSKICKFCAM